MQSTDREGDHVHACQRAPKKKYDVTDFYMSDLRGTTVATNLHEFSTAPPISMGLALDCS
jgi:hypothetical protein